MTPMTSGENELRDLVLKHFTPTRHRLTYEKEGTDAVRVSADMLAFCGDFAAALDRRPAGLGTVSVKPLEWAHYQASETVQIWSDDTSFYGVTFKVKKSRFSDVFSVEITPSLTRHPSFKTLEAGQNYCHEELTRRVKSCLTSIGVEAGK